MQFNNWREWVKFPYFIWGAVALHIVLTILVLPWLLPKWFAIPLFIIALVTLGFALYKSGFVGFFKNAESILNMRANATINTCNAIAFGIMDVHWVFPVLFTVLSAALFYYVVEQYLGYITEDE
jgi:hypothetical protein